ncbi:DUF2349 [Nesidiocoris tenuis]|uniref:DUF2349 n=1 Tax=Nesidiocoris tenuis TaxID=355587 RepID=A0ABN7AVN4_9HEMI|nr:DUF2349 [Nesidiocoris tenuis]
MDLSVAWLLCSASAFGAVVIREMFVWLRNAIPKSVECWFCMHKTEVPWDLRNNWHCPQCEQYNGFTKDGDYNKPLPQQRDESLNFSVLTLGRNRRSPWQSTKSLCNDCNAKQQLKIEQLAKFVPLNEKNYDKEVEHFKLQIDKAYQLCNDCESLVSSIFSKERGEFGLPRQLNSNTAHPKGANGTVTLYFNIVVSAILCCIGFVQTAWATVLKRELEPLASKIAKTYLDRKYAVLISPKQIRSTAILCADYIILIGALLSLVAYFRSQKRSILILFNSLTWLIFLVVSLWLKNAAWLPACEIIFGITSCILSMNVLMRIYSDRKHQQLKRQAVLQPAAFHTPASNYSYSSTWTKQQTRIHSMQPPTTSTPRNTPPDSSFNTIEPSNITRTVWRAGPDTLEPRIRDLNLNASQVRNGSLFSQRTVDQSAGSATLTASLKNANAWSTFGQNVSINSAPPGFGRPASCCSQAALSHIYSASTICDSPSRPMSPIMPSPRPSQFATLPGGKLGETYLRSRLAPSSFR